MPSQRPWMFYGWLVVGCTLFAMALTTGIDRSFGVAVIPLSAQFGWSRASLSTVVLITGLISSLFQLMIGVLVDRVGPRYVLAAGVAGLGLTVWLLTVATTIWQFGLAYGLLGGLALAATRQVVAATKESPSVRPTQIRKPGSSSTSALPEERRWASCESISFPTSVNLGFPM